MQTGIPTPPYDGQNQKLVQQQQQQQQQPQQPRPVSRKSSNSSSPPATVPSSRSAKSGSGSHATASHTNGTATHQHHHNSHRASKRSGSTPTSSASHSHSHSHHTASSTSHHASSTSASAAAAAAAAVAHSHGSPHHDGDGRHKRVWKACERCRMKKTKVRKGEPWIMDGSLESSTPINTNKIRPRARLTPVYSVTASSLVSGAKTTVLSAQLAPARRQSTSKYRKGTYYLSPVHYCCSIDQCPLVIFGNVGLRCLGRFSVEHSNSDYQTGQL